METKFTKGDWKSSGYAVLSDGNKVAETGFSSVDYDDEEQANAHLIAAAPDMYSALDEVTKLRDGDMSQAVDWLLDNTDDLIKLLKKATGE